MHKTKPWINKANRKHKKGSLHRQLGIPQDQKIPKIQLRRIVATPIGQKVGRKKVTRLLKQRSIFALNSQKSKR